LGSQTEAPELRGVVRLPAHTRASSDAPAAFIGFSVARRPTTRPGEVLRGCPASTDPSGWQARNAEADSIATRGRRRRSAHCCSGEGRQSRLGRVVTASRRVQKNAGKDVTDDRTPARGSASIRRGRARCHRLRAQPRSKSSIAAAPSGGRSAGSRATRSRGRSGDRCGPVRLRPASTWCPWCGRFELQLRTGHVRRQMRRPARRRRHARVPFASRFRDPHARSVRACALSASPCPSLSPARWRRR